MAYSFDGPLTVGNGSLRWYPRKSGAITEVHAVVDGAPAGSELTIRVRKNKAITIGTIHIAPAGNVDSFVPTPGTYVLGDYFTVDIVAVGSGAPGADLVVQIVGTFNG
jgi:hypothetical protein